MFATLRKSKKLTHGDLRSHGRMERVALARGKLGGRHLAVWENTDAPTKPPYCSTRRAANIAAALLISLPNASLNAKGTALPI